MDWRRLQQVTHTDVRAVLIFLSNSRQERKQACIRHCQISFFKSRSNRFYGVLFTLRQFSIWHKRNMQDVHVHTHMPEMENTLLRKKTGGETRRLRSKHEQFQEVENFHSK